MPTLIRWPGKIPAATATDGRATIIDLSPAGNQPMSSPCGRVTMVYNGEVYNFQQLRRRLKARGHSFDSHCDSEVVLRSYLEWGPECVRRFCGMFALAVWDSRRELLFLARDPLGMKPLYYTTEITESPGFYFASELRAFRAIPGFKPGMDRTALASFMEFGYTFDPHLTAYKGVRKLPPGHTLTVRKGKPELPEPYFSPPTAVSRSHLPNGTRAGEATDDDTDADSRTELFAALDTVVRQHLIADVPVAVLLSGGLDSSLVASLACRDRPVTTISMGFEGGNFSELKPARRVAEFIGSDHQEVTIKAREIRDSLRDTVRVFDDIFADWGTVTTRLLYKKCRERGIKVVLVGEGSDEVFGGYPKFENALDLSGPRPWRLLRLWHNYGHRRYGRTMWPFFRTMNRYLAGSGGDWFHAVRLFETRHQLPNNYVMKVDKASMSVSVEARAPFLDHRIAGRALSLPKERLLKNGRRKAILREIAAEHELLPPETVNRPKFGGSIAMNWMDDDPEFRSFARDVVLDGNARWTDRLGLRGAMEDYFDEGRRGYPFPHPLSLLRVIAWRLMQLNLWSEHYL